MRRPTKILASLDDHKQTILLTIATAINGMNADDHQNVLAAVHTFATLMGENILTTGDELKTKYHDAFAKTKDDYDLLTAIIPNWKTEKENSRVYRPARRIAEHLPHLLAVTSSPYFEASSYSTNHSEDKKTVLAIRKLITEDDVWSLLNDTDTIKTENHDPIQISFRPQPELRDNDSQKNEGGAASATAPEPELKNALLVLAKATSGMNNEADRQAVLWAVHSLATFMEEDILKEDNGLKDKYHNAFRKTEHSFHLLNAMSKKKAGITTYEPARHIAEHLPHLLAVTSSPYFETSSYSTNPSEDKETVLAIRKLITDDNVWSLLHKLSLIETKNHGERDTSFRPYPKLRDVNPARQQETEGAAADDSAKAEEEAPEAGSAQNTDAESMNKKRYAENRNVTKKLKPGYTPTKEDFETLSNNLMYFSSEGLLDPTARTFSPEEKAFLLKQYQWICEELNYKVYCNHIKTPYRLKNTEGLRIFLEATVNRRNPEKEAAIKRLTLNFLAAEYSYRYLKLEGDMDKDYMITFKNNLDQIKKSLNKEATYNKIQAMKDSLPKNTLNNVLDPKSNATEATITSALEPSGEDQGKQEEVISAAQLPIDEINSLLKNKPKEGFFNWRFTDKLKTYYEKLANLLVEQERNFSIPESTKNTVINNLKGEFVLTHEQVTNVLNTLQNRKEDDFKIPRYITDRLVFLSAAESCDALDLEPEQKASFQSTRAWLLYRKLKSFPNTKKEDKVLALTAIHKLISELLKNDMRQSETEITIKFIQDTAGNDSIETLRINDLLTSAIAYVANENRTSLVSLPDDILNASSLQVGAAARAEEEGHKAAGSAQGKTADAPARPEEEEGQEAAGSAQGETANAPVLAEEEGQEAAGPTQGETANAPVRAEEEEEGHETSGSAQGETANAPVRAEEEEEGQETAGSAQGETANAAARPEEETHETGSAQGETANAPANWSPILFAENTVPPGKREEEETQPQPGPG